MQSTELRCVIHTEKRSRRGGMKCSIIVTIQGRGQNTPREVAIKLYSGSYEKSK